MTPFPFKYTTEVKYDILLPSNLFRVVVYGLETFFSEMNKTALEELESMRNVVGKLLNLSILNQLMDFASVCSPSLSFLVSRQCSVSTRPRSSGPPRTETWSTISMNIHPAFVLSPSTTNLQRMFARPAFDLAKGGLFIARAREIISKKQ